MRKRQTNPVILIATVIALALGAWWNNAERTAPDADRRATAPDQRASGPETRAAERRAPETRATEVAAPERDLATVVPDAAERKELRQTLDRIERGGPFPYKQDGTIFNNREKRLPQHPRGYYREYTVRTPGASNRGARRVVRGDGGEIFYTRDHYESFTRID